MRTLAALLLTFPLLAAPVPLQRSDADPLARGYMGVRAGGEDSVVISSVEPNTPAARCGLKAGDRFLQVGPVKPQTFDQVREFIVSLRPGTRVNLVVQRGDEKLALVIELAVKVDIEVMELIDP